MSSKYLKYAACLAVSIPAIAAAQPAPPPGGPPGGMPAMPSMAETKYDATVEIVDGRLVPSTVAVQAASLSGSAAKGLRILSSKEGVNALIVRGPASDFTLTDPAIVLSGAGTNDFLGTGAGILVRDKARFTLRGGSVETSARISPALVAAEGATVKVHDARLVANGGPLPPGYVPRIGPWMMQPPAPLGLEGTARAVLAMSNSRTYLYNTRIEAQGWGALSTDATGGDLYLEANDCTVLVTGKGYGAYADFGAHVVLNRTSVDVGSDLGIIAGKARIDLNTVGGKAGRSGVMIHSVMAFDPAETADLTVTDSTIETQGPVLLVKSANANITVTGGALKSASGVLMHVRRNDDPNATKTGGKPVPGVTLTLKSAKLTGDVLDSDPDRATTLVLDGASLEGSLRDVVLKADATGHWRARSDSTVFLAPGTPLSVIDAPAGVTVTVTGGTNGRGTVLPSGGKLTFSR